MRDERYAGSEVYMKLQAELLTESAPRRASGYAADEWHSGDDLRRAVNLLKQNGYVILKNLLPPELIESLRAEYASALDAKVRRFNLKRVAYYDERGRHNDNVLNDFKPEGGNHDLNRWNMHLPSRLPFFDARVVAHPAVLALLAQVFDGDHVCYLVASDTPYPGAGYQNLHQDFSRFSVALNIPLVDFTDDNAPIEIWPGTHRPDIGGSLAHYSTDSYFIDVERMRQIKATVPSKRLLLGAGSILVRDHRLVHRGTANRSQHPRPMLSIYFASAHAVPYRRVADLGARGALALRRLGRGQGEKIQFPTIFNLGNVLGRVVEECSLSDRDYRRRIPAAVWEQLPPSARHTLRFAAREQSAGRAAAAAHGSLGGCWAFGLALVQNIKTVLTSALLSKPREPDEDARSSHKT